MRAATLEVRAASVFGEAIIAIVYLPILALTGVEGKLFRPMATTVLLALARRVHPLAHARAGADELLRRARAQGEHETWLLRKLHAAVRAGACAGPCASVGWTLSARRCSRSRPRSRSSRGSGAEFVPQLDEGDLLVEARRLPGVALTESVATITRMQRASLQVPEVDAASSARPARPSSPPTRWASSRPTSTSGSSERDEWRDGLDEGGRSRARSPSALEAAVPEVAGGISQPIQMRTNELVAGVRSDVAVLLYGPRSRQLLALGERAAARSEASPAPSTCASSRWLGFVPARDPRPRQARALRPHRRRRQPGHRDDGGRARRRAWCSRASAASASSSRLAHGFAGELAPLLALPLRSVSGQIVPLGDVAELEHGHGPRPGQPREPVAPHHRRVQRPRSRSAVGRGRGAGGGGARGRACPPATASSGAASSSTTKRRKAGCSWSCRSRSC